MILRLLVDIADFLSLFEKAEQVDRKYLLVGEVRFVIVALSLNRSCKATSVVSANEQIDSNERMLDQGDCMLKSTGSRRLTRPALNDVDTVSKKRARLRPSQFA